MLGLVLYGVQSSVIFSQRKMIDYNRIFRDLIYSSKNWAAQGAASRLQQAWCTWPPEDREEYLLFGKGDVLGIVNIVIGYPELQIVYTKYLNNEYVI